MPLTAIIIIYFVCKDKNSFAKEMDTITHIVLGACIGEVIAGRQLGKKALVLGAIAQNIPDIDFVASFWLPTAAEVLAHRGFTHSILFAALVTPLLAWISATVFSKSALPFRKWLVFWGVQILVHDFIDAFNVYGTGWFEPFSHYRVTFNTMFVADPLFSLWPAIAMVLLFILKNSSHIRKKLAIAALGISAFYLLLGILFKSGVDASISDHLKANNISYNRYFSTPTPLNNLLWYVVAENDSGYYIGYRSVLDRGAGINFHYVSRNNFLLQSYEKNEDMKHLIRFSKGYYSAEVRHDTLVYNDLRFEEIAGWPEPQANFVFHYYVQYPDANKMVVQRGRFANWDRHTLHMFLERISGRRR
jgi:inner membrane protein